MKKLILFLSAAMVALYVYAESETIKGAKKDVEAFKKEMSVKLDQLEKQIAELKAKAQKKGGDTKSKTITELEEARDGVKAKMGTLSDSSKDSWADLKKKMAESMDSLNAKVQKALKE